MKRSMIGAGALALALSLSACGNASPAAPLDAGATAVANAAPTAAAAATAAATIVAELAPTVAAAAPGAVASAATVVDAAAADPRFTTLVSLLQTTGLSEQLAEAGPYTIFAPTNEAFAALPAGTLEALAQNPALLQSILLYHVADGALTSADVGGATSAATQEGSEIQISAENGMVMLNDTATVIQPDIQVGNGVIHVIDTVLLPPDITLPAAG